MPFTCAFFRFILESLAYWTTAVGRQLWRFAGLVSLFSIAWELYRPGVWFVVTDRKHTPGIKRYLTEEACTAFPLLLIVMDIIIIRQPYWNLFVSFPPYLLHILAFPPSSSPHAALHLTQCSFHFTHYDCYCYYCSRFQDGSITFERPLVFLCWSYSFTFKFPSLHSWLNGARGCHISISPYFHIWLTGCLPWFSASFF